jgi:hypothetical protein
VRRTSEPVAAVALGLVLAVAAAWPKRAVGSPADVTISVSAFTVAAGGLDAYSR